MTWIEVSSDAIKIGLGALIAAISAYIVARLNQRNEYIKAYLTQKTKKLDSTIEILNEIHKRFAHYTANVSNYFGAKQQNYTHTANEIKDLDEEREKFRKGFDGFIEVSGYLLSLGDLMSHEKLEEYRDAMDNAHIKIDHRDDNINLSDIRNIVVNIKNLRRALLLSVGKAYEV